MAGQSCKVFNSHIIHELHILKLRADDVELPDGKRLTYSYIEHPGSVIIVPMFPNGEVIITEQFRYPVKTNFIEFPMGGLKEDEKSEDAVQREMMEEIGYKANNLVYLGMFYASNSISNEQASIYLATDLSPVKEDIAIEEIFEITYKRIPFQQVMEDISQGIITDGFTIIAAFRVQEYLKKRG